MRGAGGGDAALGFEVGLVLVAEGGAVGGGGVGGMRGETGVAVVMRGAVRVCRVLLSSSRSHVAVCCCQCCQRLVARSLGTDRAGLEDGQLTKIRSRHVSVRCARMLGTVCG